MNTALVAVPHPTIKETFGTPLLKDIDSSIKNNKLSYEINTKAVPLTQLCVMSPEIGTEKREATVSETKKGYSTININLEEMKIYAVAQQV